MVRFSSLLLRTLILSLFILPVASAADDWWKQYDGPRTERENVFAFTQKPTAKYLGNDKYEITFTVKANCDVAVSLIDKDGKVVRHIAAGVLGKNAPAPLQKNSLSQKISWDGKDDLGVYLKNPEVLRLRVQLGMKPTFDKLLGSKSPHNIPGKISELAADKDGVYVLSRGYHAFLRKFNHDGSYSATLLPPPANLPKEKLGGRTFVEYEPNKFSHFGPKNAIDMGFDSETIPGLPSKEKALKDIQPAISNGRFYYCNSGAGYFSGKTLTSTMNYFFTDGSTNVEGLKGRLLFPYIIGHASPRLAASPDGKWIYMVGINDRTANAGVVMRCPTAGAESGKPFIGKTKGSGKKLQFVNGTANDQLNGPIGIDCDTQGRVYVSDSNNNRVQIFTAEGKYLKTITVQKPDLLFVHKKTGAIYVFHKASVKGKSHRRITKYTSFDKPQKEFHSDPILQPLATLDSWSAKPRIWLAGVYSQKGPGPKNVNSNVQIIEENGKGFKKVFDFDQEITKVDGTKHPGRWIGAGRHDHVVCDPVREWVYYRGFRANAHVFDLKSGELLRTVKFPGGMNDLACDKRGLLHAHFDPGFYMPGVGRMDPEQISPYINSLGRQEGNLKTLKEVPYDYGVPLTAENRRPWVGGLPVKDQPGAKYFQDGFGVNMKGDLAVQTNIYYIPKGMREGYESAFSGRSVRDARGIGSGPDPYAAYVAKIQDKLKRGEQLYSLPKHPGLPSSGGTIWTYDYTGEIRDECAVISRKILQGALIDEDGFLYFANDRVKVRNNKPFMQNRGGNFGMNEPMDKGNKTPITYTYMKTQPQKVRWLLSNANVKLDPIPTRDSDLAGWGATGFPVMKNSTWVKGALWMYAGQSPAVAAGCSCPHTRPYLDWFKRSYIPEAYRRSIGILDTNGNVIAHFGRYGNFDSGNGKDSKIPVGGDNIGLTMPRFVSATDNFISFNDWGERLVVLKINYHAEEITSIAMEKK